MTVIFGSPSSSSSIWHNGTQLSSSRRGFFRKSFSLFRRLWVVLQGLFINISFLLNMTDFAVQLYSSRLWIRKRSPAPEIPEYDGWLQVIGDSLHNYLHSQLRPVVDTRSGDWVWILWMVMFSASFFNMNIIAIRWIDYSEWFRASDASHPPGITAKVGLCIASFKVSFSLQSETGPEIFINLWFFEFLIRGKRGSRDPLEVLATNFLSSSINPYFPRISCSNCGDLQLHQLHPHWGTWSHRHWSGPCCCLLEFVKYTNF